MNKKYNGNELKYLKKVLNKETWSSTSGSWVNEFEKAFAEKMGVKYAIAFNSGTAPLQVALMALNSEPRFEVIQPSLTVIMNTFATVSAFGIPVYVDIDPVTWTIDVDKIERAITDKTKAIMPVSLYGIHADIDRINKLAEKYNLLVVEDNAQCPDTTNAYCATYSFESSKHLSTGEGGMLITNHEEFAMRARKRGGIGYKNLKASEGRVKLNQEVFQDPDYQRHDTLGYNFRMTEFQAAIGIAQLERYDELIGRRIVIGEMYLDAIKDCEFLKPQVSNQKHFYWTFPVLYIDKDNWKEFRKAYIKNGGDGIYAAWVPPYREKVMEIFNFQKLPITEFVQPRLMQFKTNYRDMKDAERAVKALKKTIEEIS